MQLLTAGRYDVTMLAFAPTGTGLVAVCTTHSPVWWNLPATGSPVPLTHKAMYSCSSFTFSPDARVLGWITETAIRMEHDRRTGTFRAVTVGPKQERVHTQTVCGPDGRLVVGTTGQRGEFHLRALAPADRSEWGVAWSIGPTRTYAWGLVGSLRSERFFSREASPSNKRTPDRLVVRSAITGEVLAETPLPVNYVSGFATKADGSALIMFKDSSLYYWQPGEKTEKIRTGTLTHYQSLAFHPDGRHLLAGNNDATARLIDTRTWQVVRQYAWAVGRLSAVAISPDSQLAAAGGAKGRVVVWDLDI